MITFIFICLMLAVFGKLAVFALKASWGIAKFVVSIVLFPLALIVMALSGLIYVAIVVLVIAGIVLLIKSLTS